MTYAEYVAMLAGLTVAGVAKRFNQAPAQLSTAQLPAQWPRLPQGESAPATLGAVQTLDTLQCDLVIAVEAMGQNTQPANWTKAIGIIDGLHAALKAEAADGVIDKWQIKLDAEAIGDTAYWVIAATVTGSA